MKTAERPHHSIRTAARRAELNEQLQRILPPDSRLVWEVGCGHGHFLAAYATAHPKDLCVGVDISSDRIARAGRKRERGRLANLHFILADAIDFLAALPKGSRIPQTFILFPDPWPKRRHHKNRILAPAFLGALATFAPRGACLHFRTDHEPYFREAEAVVGQHAAWARLDAGVLPFEEPTVFQKRAQKQFTLAAERR